MMFEKQAFNSAEELFNFFGELGNKVPARHAKQHGVRQEKKEIYCIEKYLTALAAMQKLNFPFTLYKQESPDFIIDYGLRRVGVEIAEVTTEKYQKWLTGNSEAKEPEFYTLLPYGGDDPEMNCSEAIVAITKKKNSLLANYNNNSQMDDCHLLLYENIDGFVEAESLFGISNVRLSLLSHEFSELSIICDESLLYAIGTKHSELCSIPKRRVFVR